MLLGLLVIVTLLAPRPAGAATPRRQLLALTEAMSRLHPTSVRVQGDSMLTGTHLTGPLKKLRGYSISGSGELAEGPTRGTVSFTSKGHAYQLRIVEGTVYVYIPAIAAKDDGRPWVSETVAPEKQSGSDSEGGSIAEVGLNKAAALLSSATHVRALGAREVDGQETRGFAGTVAPHLLEQDRVSRSVREVLERVRASSSARFETFIAPDGLPVRTLFTLTVGRATLRIESQVTAIDFPLTVLAPPVGETISTSELEALERAGTFG